MHDFPLRCAMTGRQLRDSDDGIWDDGEWISWAWINAQIAEQESGAPDEEIEHDDEIKRVDECDPVDEDESELPEPSAELLFRIFAARSHYENTLNEISPDWGPIGEAYLEECFGAKLSRPHTQGHDGHLGNELIEIKTISPHKRRQFVTVKRAGNFSLLAVVRITNDGEVAVRFVPRDKLPRGNGGKRVVLTWKKACQLGNPDPGLC